MWSNKLSYTVDNLLEKLAVVGQNKIWKEIPESVTVQGLVSNIKLYSHKSYFDLIGSGRKIRACCDAKDTPSEGAAIEFNGLVTLKTSTHSTNLQVIINGSPIGTWERFSQEGVSLTKGDLVKYNNQPLSSLIGSFNLHKLLLIGTKTAIGDIESIISKDSLVTVIASEITVSKKEEVLSALKTAKHDLKEKEDFFISAFAVIRGGDDDSMGVWDDPVVVKAMLDVGIPFFTALGHSHRVTLADKYAAQSFPTPGNFASSINEEVRRYEYLHSLIHEKNKLTDELKNNDRQLKNIEISNQHKDKDFIDLSDKYKWLKIAFFVVCLLFLVVLGLGIYLLPKLST